MLKHDAAVVINEAFATSSVHTASHIQPTIVPLYGAIHTTMTRVTEKRRRP